MSRLLDYIVELTDKTINFARGYYNLECEINNSVIAISDKINYINYNKPVKDIFPEIIDVKDYVVNKIKIISSKVKQLSNIFRVDKNLEDKVSSFEIQMPNNNYTTRIKNLTKNYSKNTTNIAEILSGKSAWRWEKREESLLNYINSNKFIDGDYSGLKEIKSALENNKYLRYNHSKIYSRLTNKINKIIEYVK